MTAREAMKGERGGMRARGRQGVAAASEVFCLVEAFTIERSN